MGKRTDLIKSCIDAAAEQDFNIKGMSFDAKSYCYCFIDKLTPNVYSWEIINAMKKGDIIDLITEDKNWKILKECLAPSIEFSDDLKYSDLDFGEYEEKAIAFMVKTCVDDFFSDQELSELFTMEEVATYCSCALLKLIISGFSLSDIQSIENVDSEIFNEISLECLNDLLLSVGLAQSNNSYVAEDIIGRSYSSQVPLIDYLGKGFKLKISINGITKYFLFDTGASDLVIDTETERELLLNGTLKRENYIGKMQYELANKDIVTGHLVLLNNVSIGDYKVNNVVAAIIEKGSLLCGKSFFDKFRKWEVDFKNKTVTLYK
jgi:clan AA aspartic protease (TIGR02281 family)